ncbi:hypothetical protein JRX38_02400 [Gluconobacter cerinus]|uniref:helix-turn-helix transcriptional regulator n=1 Tax=Gluconobacter cerinus TaxID=38307 RepID=UPI00193FB0F0|nr:hypothetical protein [Gluconobacter cerinus]MBM3096881.1 hypothetical protein [Gluconobacter cerinus]
MTDKRLYTTREAAGYLALSESSFRTAVAPHCRKLSPVPGRVAWAKEDLDAWVDGLLGTKRQSVHAPMLPANPLDRFVT